MSISRRVKNAKKKESVKAEASSVSKAGDLNKLIEKAAEELSALGKSSEKEVEGYLKKKYGLKNVNSNIVRKVVREIKNPSRLYLYEVENGEMVRKKRYDKTTSALYNAYFALLREGKMPTLNRVTEKMEDYGVKVSRRWVANFMEREDLGLVVLEKGTVGRKSGNISNVYLIEDSILQETKRRLESGEPLIVAKGKIPDPKEALKFFLRRKASDSWLRRTLGFSQKEINEARKKLNKEQ